MPAAREGWIRWCRDDPSMAVVDDLVELRGWTRTAAPGARGAVAAAVAARTKDDQAAVAALVWLLLPGACHTAEQLHDLAPDVDALVAGQLWIEAASAWQVQVQGLGVAQTILRRTRREVCAELGVGDGAERRDRVWASSVRVERLDEVIAADEEEGDPFGLVTALLMEAMDDGVVEVFDAWLIGELARVAHSSGAPGRRGRQGLTAPAVVETVAQQVHLSTRGLRWRAVKTVDRIAEYLAVRDDPARFAVWRARHPAESVATRDQMQLVITDDESAYWVRSRFRAAGESAREELWEQRSGRA